jgi:hypothetical protein
VIAIGRRDPSRSNASRIAAAKDFVASGHSCSMRCLLAVVVALAASCVRVQPHERETLARRSMNPRPAPAEQKLDDHVEEYREGSIGGSSAGGGGCGCN